MSKHINLSGLKTLLEPLVHLINKKAERPDWNENDPSSPSYIEGRTHWEESEVIVTFDGVFSEEDLLPEELTNIFGNMVRVSEPILLDSQPYFTILRAILISNTNKKFTGSLVYYSITDTVDLVIYIDDITKESIQLGVNVKETPVEEEESITLKEGFYLSYEEDFYYTEIRKLKIQQIDKKFLPTESVDWYSPMSEINCIKNRTHYENVNKYSFNSRNRDNYQSCNIVFNNTDFTCFKINEAVPSLEKIKKNGQVSLYMSMEPVMTEGGELIPASELIISHEEEGYYIVQCEFASFFICNNKQLLPETMSSLNEGIWLAFLNEASYIYGEASFFEFNLYITQDIKQLDEKFIPDTIARISDLDSVQVEAITNDQIDALFEDGFFPPLPNANGVNF